MPLTPGSKVGIYDVVEMIGVGGMGEVYRANDSRLDRAVAIKTLPEEFSTDRDRLARFEREARVLAQLNHPHIASIYGIEPGPPVALAMEMADGDTLSHRIQLGALDVDDAILIARQIAEGLEHAHGKGIVHRDLKPANIKIGTHDGKAHVKILDFGLAKAMSRDSSASSMSPVSSPTITSPANLTRAGVVLGTAAYMAPEQARGRYVDHRADIWAFGCVLFEMLTGRRAFGGDEVADAFARVIQSEPEWSLLPASVPPRLRVLLQRCLRKDPHHRLHSIADVRIELEDLASQPEVAAVVPRRVNGWLIALSGLAAGAVIATAGVSRFMTPAPAISAPAEVIRFALPPQEGFDYYRLAGSARFMIALSPDGEKFAAVVMARDGITRKVMVRNLADTAFRDVTGTEGAGSVFWAPDGARIGFNTPSGLRIADISGGGSRVMTTNANLFNARWSSGDMLVAQADAEPLMVWPANTNTPAPLGTLTPEVEARILPRWLPGGQRVMFVDSLGNGAWKVRVTDLAGTVTDVTSFESGRVGTSGIDYQSGHLLICTTDTSGRTALTAQPLDATTLKLSGTPTVIATDINCAFTASNNGRLAYGNNRTVQSRFVWLDGRGAVLSKIGDGMERSGNFAVSHDGRFIVAQQSTGMVLHDVERGATSPLNVIGTDPAWSPDDSEIAYTVPQDGIFAMPRFGGKPRILYKSTSPTYVEDWSHDGRWLAAVAVGDGVMIPLPGGAPIPLGIASPYVVVDELQFSPDSQWLAYAVLQSSGTNQVFMTAMPPSGPRFQVSVAGGSTPRWAADGHSLYFLDPAGVLMRVDVTVQKGAAPKLSTPRRIADAVKRLQPTLDQFSVTRDGRFLVRDDELAPGSGDSVQVIINWPSLLRRGTQAGQQQ